jgi:hypothetical protein
MSRIPGGFSVRNAVVTKVYNTQVECQFYDRVGEHNVRCPIPHPHAGVGTGIFVGVQVGTRVLISYGPQEIPYIVAVIPDRSYYFDQGGVEDSSVDTDSYPAIEAGEIYLTGPLNSSLELTYTGNIAMESGAGDVGADLELSQLSQALYVRTNNIYNFSEAGRKIEGVIKRDKSTYEDPNDTATLNFLSSEAYDYNLVDIGRSAGDEVSLRSSQVSKLTFRNPSLIEKRDITYEFADSFGVRDLISEATATNIINTNDVNSSSSNIVVTPSDRERRRTDTLDLNLRNFNHLIEHTEGTVVDIYGNVLDINRNKIDIPGLEYLGASGGKIDQKLARIYSYLRRSIKYHFEINARKDLTTPDPPIKNTSYNANEHGRWSVDVDGEGLTKINIPASSETGNIPVLGRYIVSRDPNNKQDPTAGQWRDPQSIDVRLLPFGAISTNNGVNSIAGPTIVDSSYNPTIVSGSYIDGYVGVGTAHHNILTIAPSVFQFGKLTTIDPLADGYNGPVNTQIVNSILPLQPGQNYQTNPNANAGGRSINANLDGSAEISIGADTADRKSLVLDLAGGVVSHYGRDRNGRSLIHQTDGDVIVQIGGLGISGDSRFIDGYATANRPGRIEIHLNQPGKQSSTGDFTISAGANLLLDGRQIYTYGESDASINSTRTIEPANTEAKIDRSGRNIS